MSPFLVVLVSSPEVVLIHSLLPQLSLIISIRSLKLRSFNEGFVFLATWRSQRFLPHTDIKAGVVRFLRILFMVSGWLSTSQLSVFSTASAYFRNSSHNLFNPGKSLFWTFEPFNKSSNNFSAVLALFAYFSRSSSQIILYCLASSNSYLYNSHNARAVPLNQYLSSWVFRPSVIPLVTIARW